jgi:hypothetical protein
MQHFGSESPHLCRNAVVLPTLAPRCIYQLLFSVDNSNESHYAKHIFLDLSPSLKAAPMRFEHLSRKSRWQGMANGAVQAQNSPLHLPRGSVLAWHLSGNQYQRIMKQAVTSALPREESEETEQRSMSTWSKLWERTKDTVGLDAVNNQVLAEFQNALEKSQRLCEYGAMLTQDDAAEEWLTQAAEKFSSVAGTIETTLDITGNMGEILAFVDAVDAVADVDVEREPHKAAEAFGNLFELAGKVGQVLPDGAWTAYFAWLAEAGDFFACMVNKIVPQFSPQPQEQLLLADHDAK